MKRAKDRLSSAMLRTATALIGLLAVALAGMAQPAAAPSRYIVKDIITQGLSAVPAGRVTGTIKTHAGMEYSRDLVEEDVRALVKTGLFGNVRVQIEYVGGDPARAREVIVHFLFVEYPGKIQEIVYEGAGHGNADDLGIVAGIRKGGAMNPTLNRMACESIVNWYREKGRPLAHVELREGTNVSDSRVVFNITEGPIVRVQSVAIQGNQFIGEAVLKTHVDSHKAFLGIMGGKYNPEIVQHDISKLEEYYHTYGFHDIHVQRELLYSGDLQYVTVIFHVQEGPRYHVTGAQLEVFDHNGEHNDPAGVKDRLELIAYSQPGAYYDGFASKQKQEEMKDNIGMKGYQANVNENIVFDEKNPGECRLVYNVREDGPARVKEIKIIGDEVTRQNIILRQLRVYPGQVLTYPDLRVSEQRLARLGIFKTDPENGIRPTVTAIDDPNDPNNIYKDVLVQVTEDRTGSITFGLGVNSDQGLTGSIVLNERNFDIFNPPTSLDDILGLKAFRGAGQEFRLEAVPGTLTQRYAVSFKEPYLFDTENSLKVDGYYYQHSYNEDTESRLGGRVTVGRRFLDHWTVSGSTRVEEVGIHNVGAGAPPDYQNVVGDNFLVGLRAGVNFDTRDSYLRPTEGTVLDASYEQVLGDFIFPKINLEANQYFTVYKRADGSGRHVVALHSQMSWAGSQAPVFERYYAGGYQSLRGFAFRGVGPVEAGYSVGGDFQWLNSVEYQVPIMANDRLYFVAFVDSGTVESNVEIKDYRVSAGVGLRIVVPMLGPVPIALDLGFPVVRSQMDHTQAFSFWLGFFH